MLAFVCFLLLNGALLRNNNQFLISQQEVVPVMVLPQKPLLITSPMMA
jgi:hypothetical protein